MDLLTLWSLTTSFAPCCLLAKLPVCVLDVLSTFYGLTWQRPSPDSKCFPLACGHKQLKGLQSSTVHEHKWNFCVQSI